MIKKTYTQEEWERLSPITQNIIMQDLRNENKELNLRLEKLRKGVNND